MMLVRFFKDIWGELRSGNPGAYIAVFFIVGLIVLTIIIFNSSGPECTKYTINYGTYSFHVDNYSQTENSVTFQRGSTNITLVGNFAIYENNCSRGD